MSPARVGNLSCATFFISKAHPVLGTAVAECVTSAAKMLPTQLALASQPLTGSVT